MPPASSSHDKSFNRWAASLGASFLAETATLPLDVVKTRLQVARDGRGASAIVRDTLRDEGARAFWKGLGPALLRQMCYTSLSLVLYNPVRDFLSRALDGAPPSPPSPSKVVGSSSSPPPPVSFGVRLLAGGTAGGTAIFVFNFTDVIKTKIQTSKEPVGVGQVVRRIYGNGGILGFWAGWRPNVARTFIVNAAELGSYDQIKTEVFVPWVGNTPLAHIGASGVAGVFSALVSTPVDTVKTRWMNEMGGGGRGGGMVARGLRILREEGVLTLYSGFAPICIRKVFWCSAFFCSYEYFLTLI